MNPAWIHAAESLLPALAKGELDGATVTLLSEQQVTLRISPHLVYMCGMVTQFQRVPPFSRDQGDWFHHLQSLYQKEKGSESSSSNQQQQQPFYHLSPTLLPSNAVQEMIYQTFKRRQDEIEEQAAQAQTILLTMEIQDETILIGQAKKVKSARQGRRRRQQQQSQGIPHGGDSTGSRDQSDEENQDIPNANIAPIIHSTTTLEDLMKPQFTQEEQNIVVSADWTEVKTKKRTVEVSIARPLVDPETENLANQEEKLVEPRDSLDFHGTEAPGIGPCERHALEEISLPGDDSLGKQLSTHLSSTEATASSHDDDELTLLRTTVRRLELELARKDELLQNERAAHSKALQLEKEQSHERLQGLQLRLYISETRLKTFEDALEQHMQTVTNNMVVVGSPERRAWRTTRHVEEEEQVATPLYSRACRK